MFKNKFLYFLGLIWINTACDGEMVGYLVNQSRDTIKVVSYLHDPYYKGNFHTVMLPPFDSVEIASKIGNLTKYDIPLDSILVFIKDKNILKLKGQQAIYDSLKPDNSFSECAIIVK